MVGLIRRHTETSIPPHRLVRLVALALTIPPEQVGRARVPGTAGRAGDASVLLLGPDAERLFADLRDDGVLDVGVAAP